MSERIRSQGTVQVDGAVLHYQIEGEGRPALVIGSATYYPRTFSRQLRNSLRLCFVDARHFAEVDGSRPAESISLDVYLKDIDRVRARLGVEHAVIIGHSHHGNLALEYAKQYPERASHLVLIGSPPVEVNRITESAEGYWAKYASENRKVEMQRRLNALDPDALEQMAPGDAFVTRYVAEGPKYWYEADYDASHLWHRVSINMDVVEVFRDFFANGYRMEWDPSQMSAPVLAIMGRHDYMVPYILWDDVRPVLNNLSFHLFNHSGHTPQLEEPEHFDRTLLEWLATTGSEGSIRQRRGR
jgi:proline iminopeptidase